MRVLAMTVKQRLQSFLCFSLLERSLLSFPVLPSPTTALRA